MAQVRLDTGFNIEVDFVIAAFAKRMAAWIIDLLACWLYVAVVSSLTGTISFFVFTNVWELGGLLISLPILFYHLVSEVSLNGKSLGKLVMNIQVITAEGGQPSLGQYMIRWIFRLVDFPYWIPFAVGYNALPWWTMPLTFAGVIFILFTDRSQRIGDIVAGTILIDLKKTASWEDTVFTEIEANYKPMFPQVMQLTDRDINTLKSVIETVRKKNDQFLAEKIAGRIKSKLHLEYDGSDLDFLVILLKDYNFYSS